MAEHDPQPGADERMASEVGRMFVNAQRTADALVLGAQREVAELLDVARRQVQERALSVSSGRGPIGGEAAVGEAAAGEAAAGEVAGPTERTDTALLLRALDEVEAKLRRSQAEMLTQIAKLGHAGPPAPVPPLSDETPQVAPPPGPEAEPVALNGFVAGHAPTEVVQPPAQTLPAAGPEPVDEAFRRNASRPHPEMPYGWVADEPTSDPVVPTPDHVVSTPDPIGPSSDPVALLLDPGTAGLPSEEAVGSPTGASPVSAPVVHQHVTAKVGRPAWIANVAVAMIVLVVVVAVLALLS